MGRQSLTEGCPHRRQLGAEGQSPDAVKTHPQSSSQVQAQTPAKARRVFPKEGSPVQGARAQGGEKSFPGAARVPTSVVRVRVQGSGRGRSEGAWCHGL